MVSNLKTAEELELKIINLIEYINKPSLLNEVWAGVQQFPNYQVSTLGRLKNVKTGRFLKLCTDVRGYKVANLCNRGQVKLFKIHRLVCQTFILNPYKKPGVDHKNGEKGDNTLLNLRWCTQLENCRNTKRYINNKTTFKGVTFCRGNRKYKAQIGLMGKILFIGYYNKPEDASRAYEKQAETLFGEFYKKNT